MRNCWETRASRRWQKMRCCSPFSTSAPNTDIALERFLTMLRGAMLRELAHSPDAGPQAEDFAAALAQQCFINEYVFLPDEGELAAAQALAERTDIAPMQLLLVAAYIPLHALAHAEKLLQRPWRAPVEAVLTQQLREPLQEQRLRADIPRLTGDRRPGLASWCKISMRKIPIRAGSGRRQRRRTPSQISSIASFPLPSSNAPRQARSRIYLIAGCGTGQCSIAKAQRFGAKHMLAVDLSLASLGYARRKSEELGLPIAYVQADILELDRETTGHRFDLIESLGVLHHLADPFAGWRALLSLLRPGRFHAAGPV